MMCIFLVTFGLYLLTMFPTVAPYRDAGEMATVSYVLGIAHPPSYPLYTLLSKIFTLVIPFGNISYRVNVLSAFFSSLLVLLLAKIVSKRYNLPVILVFLLASSYLQWYLSLVSEMYTLSIFFATLLLWLLLRTVTGGDIKLFYLASFIFGLGLGSRTDLLLLFPGIVYFLWKNRHYVSRKQIMLIAIFFVLGLSVYLYLPIRSSKHPLIDWNHPAELRRFWASLTRKTHGGTLDLISTGYKRGENFIPGLLFYLRHLFHGFAYLGLPFGILGLWYLFCTGKSLFFTTLLWFIFSGPVFIYLANMPPNTHALAILEAHFLLPNLFFFVWIVFGLLFIYERFGKNIVYFISTGMVLLNLFIHFQHLNKRENYFAYDYTTNVLRSVPIGGITILKEDVQLFSMWYRQKVMKKRLDISIIAQGLAGAGWYQSQETYFNPNVWLNSLNSSAGWQEIVQKNYPRRVYFSNDAEFIPFSGYVGATRGLLNEIVQEEYILPGLMKEFYIYRGKYKYDAYYEFFTPDIIEEYSKAYHKLGYYFMSRNDYSSSERNFITALSFQPLFPLCSYHLSYIYFASGKYDFAEKNYLHTISLYQRYIQLAKDYRAPTSVIESIHSELAEVYLHLGVTEERLGRLDKSLEYYSEAIKFNPKLAKAYFNRAVVYWHRQDWQKVIDELQKALDIDPNYKEAQVYLQRAYRNLFP